MNHIDLIEKINNMGSESLNWQQIHDEIINQHEQAKTLEERVEILELHTKFMDTIESQLSDAANLEKFRNARTQEYNMLITRECTIGGSICIETLYDLTQRELEAGRMGPTHSFITIAENAMAKEHYSRERLKWTETKIQERKNKPSFRKKISNIFYK